MPSATCKPIRRGKPTCLALDTDASALLKVLTTNGKGHGALVSELIRKEFRERCARPAMLKALAAQAAQDD
jgi:hypothetical protein